MSVFLFILFDKKSLGPRCTLVLIWSGPDNTMTKRSSNKRNISACVYFDRPTSTYRHLAGPGAVALAHSVLRSSRQEVAVLTAVHQRVAEARQVHPHHVHMQRALRLLAGVRCDPRRRRVDRLDWVGRRSLTWRRLGVRMHSGCVPLQVRSGWQVLEEEPWIKCPGWHWKDTTLPTCGQRGESPTWAQEGKKIQNVKANGAERFAEEQWVQHFALKGSWKRDRKLLPDRQEAVGKWGEERLWLVGKGACFDPTSILHVSSCTLYIYCMCIFCILISFYGCFHPTILSRHPSQCFMWPHLEAQQEESLP